VRRLPLGWLGWVGVVFLAAAACDLDRGPVTPPLDGNGKSEEARETAGALYLRFVHAVAAADTMDALGPFLEEGVRAHVAHLSPKAQDERLATHKREEPDQVKITKEAVEGDLAMLVLSGVRAGKAVRGKATLVREDRGGWRVRDEAWEK